MGYEYSESKKVLTEASPLVTRAALLLICKEVDEDTPEAETTEFIASAHVIVCNSIDGYGIPLSVVTQIEKYLAAHFAVLTYSTKSRETIGPMSRAFALKVDLGFNATRYGQMAISLDPTGMLENLRKRRVRMMSVGSGILPT